MQYKTKSSLQAASITFLVIILVFCMHWTYGQKKQSLKSWTKIGEAHYAFSLDDKHEGTLKISPNSKDSKAIIKIGQEDFTIRRVGFWKTAVEITDKTNTNIGKLYGEKWYAHTFVLDYKGTKYKLVIRNNPLSELAIMQENKLVLAYGLDAGERIQVKITSSENHQDYLLDCLLWYLFVPIATENMGDDFTFVMRSSSQ
jgi:hypothetical protein